MEKPKGTNLKVVLLFVAGFALLIFALFVVIVLAAGLIFLSPSSDSPSNLAPIIQSTTSPTNNSGSYSDPIPDSDLWDLIQTPVVEQNCLLQAKQVAGDMAWAVSACSCSEQKTSTTKSYSCSVSALDGQHPLSIDCTKESQGCVVSSEEGTYSFSFEELSSLVE